MTLLFLLILMAFGETKNIFPSSYKMLPPNRPKVVTPPSVPFPNQSKPGKFPFKKAWSLLKDPILVGPDGGYHGSVLFLSHPPLSLPPPRLRCHGGFPLPWQPRGK
uniref:Uncharacterized protein n=1 Tax=Micrurus corallinus TaxID=54390 RepID=A0A2D4GPY3_MICCO